MTRRRLVIVGLPLIWLGCSTARGAAPDRSAELFLDRIYAHYTGRNANGLSLDSPATIRGLFDPPLASLILADIARANRRDEPPALDGDPFVDAQDWLIRDIQIIVTPDDAEHARAVVNFTNFEKPKQIRFTLVRLASGWRIHEIAYPEATLLQILTAP